MGQNFSLLGIANKALLRCGAQRTSSLSNTNDPNVVSINDVFDSIIQECLQEAPFSFAINTTTLSALSLAVVYPPMNDGVNYGYGLPSDFLEAYQFSQPCQYRIEQLRSPQVTSPTQALMLDLPQAPNMRYWFNNQDPTTWSPKFYNTVSLRLAKEIAPKVSKSPTMFKEIASDYKMELLSAISSDAQASIADESEANEWFIARLAGSGVVTGLPNGNIGFFPDPYNPNF